MMRILQLHSDFIEYKPTHKEIKSAEETELISKKLEDIVVVFTCIEKGDDTETVNQSIKELTKSLKVLGANRIIIYPYAHLSTNLAAPKEAIQILKEMEKKAIDTGIEVHRAPFGWTKAFTIKVKGHPLAEQSKVFQNISSEKKESVSKALKYEEKLQSKWYIFSPDGVLTNVENYKFTAKSDLEKLKSYEISKSRTTHKTPPHVSLMKRLMIADYEPGSDSGNMRFYPKGRLIKSLLENYVTQKIREYGGIEVETPIMYDVKHPSLASYLNRFPARQYIVKSEDKELFLRFSACFGQFLMVKDIQLSYKHLPFKIYELTRYSFRREKSGEVSGLRRLRAFTMPDCHAICENLDQAKEEILKRFRLSTEVLEGIGFTKEDYQLAIRFTKQFYDENNEFLTSIISNFNRPCLAEVWDDRFFYFVFKWEFNFIDTLGKASSLSTDQIDVENAERYGILYTDENNKKQYPIILHNSPSGAIERCIYALLEKAFKIQMQGKAPYLPIWLSPTQVRLIPLNPKFQEYAEKIATELTENFVRADIDDRDESIGKRIRSGERDWVPYIAVIGEKEVSSDILYIRERISGSMKNMTLQELIKEIKNNTKGRPFQHLSLPRNISKHPQFPN